MWFDGYVLVFVSALVGFYMMFRSEEDSKLFLIGCYLFAFNLLGLPVILFRVVKKLLGYSVDRFWILGWGDFER